MVQDGDGSRLPPEDHCCKANARIAGPTIVIMSGNPAAMASIAHVRLQDVFSHSAAVVLQRIVHN